MGSQSHTWLSNSQFHFSLSYPDDTDGCRCSIYIDTDIYNYIYISYTSGLYLNKYIIELWSLNKLMHVKRLALGTLPSVILISVRESKRTGRESQKEKPLISIIMYLYSALVQAALTKYHRLGHLFLEVLVAGKLGRWLLFSCSVVSDSSQPHGLQHARPPCPPLSPRVHSRSCPLSLWCHPTIWSSVTLFSFCLQSFPASGSFQWLFASGGQSFEASTSASVLPVSIQGWFPLGLTGLISLSKGLSNTTVQMHQFFGT